MKVTASRKHELFAKLSSLRQKIAEIVRPSESTKETTFETLKFALSTTRDVADACNFAPLKGSVSVLLEVLERLDLAADVYDDLIAILKRIEKMLEAFKRYLDSQQEQRVVDFMTSLTSTVDAVRVSIETKLQRGRLERVLLARKDAEDVVRLLRIIGDTAESFSIDIDVEISARVQQVRDNLKLFDLPFIRTAQYQAIKNNGCTPDTRVDVIDELQKWSSLCEGYERPVCWVRGQAGAGKTTIMYTMSRILHGDGILGGTFFCSRDATDRRTITNIFPTIAQSLAITVPGFQNALIAGLQGKKGVGSFTPDQQFDILIAKPARHALSKAKAPWSNRVVVIDALDECDDAGEVTHMFLNILCKSASGLGIRFIVASRPELPFIHSFAGADNRWSHVIDMQTIPEEIARDDVLKFLISERAQCIETSPKRDWPTEERLKQLASDSGSLFIYASTAWRYVSDIYAINPSERLEEVLELASVPLERRIDSMYRLVLLKLWTRQSERDQNMTRRCLQALICLYEPLSIENLSLMLGVSLFGVQAVLDSLQSVIRVPRSNKNDPVTAFHASLANYLLDFKRSGQDAWHIDETESHRELCLRCWQVMRSKLHFNISRSCSSYLSNDEQGRPPEFSDGMVYACLRWIEHLSRFPPSAADMKDLKDSFSARFPFWLEVLSVLRRPQEGQRILALLTRRMRKLKLTGALPRDEEKRATDTEKFANEASQLLMAFAEPIATSAPHIYISALACENNRSLVQSAMDMNYQRLPRINTQQTRRTLPLLRLVGHENTVNSVAFSSDEKRIASGSSDRTIRVWDPDTGTEVGQPLCGHAQTINSVAFSPDGKHLVSGSSDGTLRMWDLDTGTQVGEPLRGHTRSVWSVAFSPNTKRVVSGSDDGTIRMWNPYTGMQVGEPLGGHDGSVNSVSFSPDGKRIASASTDLTVRMWDPDTGVRVGEPLRCHGRAVNCVAFSPDGKLVASGSLDNTIRLWDADMGTPFGRPLRGHSHSVKSVAFSPDSKVLVSGSLDCTIRTWDPYTGLPVGEPLHCHDRPVHSIAYSPDGSRVASGSAGHIISCWDINVTFETGGAASNIISRNLAPIYNSSAIAPSTPQSLMSTATALWDTVSLRGLSAIHDFDLDNNNLSFTLDEDGWLRGPSGELVFWVLPEYRHALCRPGDTHGLGASPVQLDFEGCPLGEDWIDCYQYADTKSPTPSQVE